MFVYRRSAANSLNMIPAILLFLSPSMILCITTMSPPKKSLIAKEVLVERKGQ